MKTWYIVGFAVAAAACAVIGVVVVAVLVWQQDRPLEVVAVDPVASPSAEDPAAAPPLEPSSPTSGPAAPGRRPSTARRPATAPAKAASGQVQPAAGEAPAAPPVPVAPRSRQEATPALQTIERQAREALAQVGLDSGAERTWIQAINNPELSAHARSDLIEDLNEDGFPDRHRITAADEPLIASRLKLIEQLLPQAMDPTNAEAFREAQKDLTKMLARLHRPQPQ